jgi:hypothetical protein
LLEITDHDLADRAGPLGFARLDPGKPTIVTALIAGESSAQPKTDPAVDLVRR